MHFDHVLKYNVLAAPKELVELLRMPVYSSDIGAEDSVANESHTFTRIAGDGDSEFHVDRERGVTADMDTTSTTLWTVREIPVIDAVETDQANDNILSEGTTRLTISGSYFGADIGDVNVFVGIQPKKNCGVAPLSRGPRHYVNASNVSVEDLDDASGGATIVCDLSLSSYSSPAELIQPLVGSVVQVFVQNNKRLLCSDANEEANLI